MLNKDFTREWKMFGGEINVLYGKHFSLSIDKEWIGFGISVSPSFRMVHIELLNIVLRFY